MRKILLLMIVLLVVVPLGVQIVAQDVSIPAYVEVLSPAQGTNVDVTSEFLSINGASRDIKSDTVTVQVRDALARPVITLVAVPGSDGAWTVGTPFLIPDGSNGSIRAFSKLADGSADAASVVDVTFTSGCTINTEWPQYEIAPGDSLLVIAQRTGSSVSELVRANCLPNASVIYSGDMLAVPRLPAGPPDAPDVPDVQAVVTVTAPGNGSVLTPGAEFSVTGTTAGNTEGNTFVRVIDNMGNVLAEERVTVTSATDANGTWGWQVNLTPDMVDAGTYGKIYAYTVDAGNARVAASQTLNISFGQVETPQFITITSHEPYAMIDTGTVEISGNGGGLFEGNVVVQAVDLNGVVVAENFGTVSAAEVGGQGPWQTTLEISESFRGSLVAFSPNPADGSRLAETVLDVVFGDPTAREVFVLINFPLPRTVVSSTDAAVVAAGEINGVFTENLLINVTDQAGNLLIYGNVTADPTTGTWSLVSTANASIAMTRSVNLQLVAVSPDGSVQAADTIPVVLRAAE